MLDKVLERFADQGIALRSSGIFKPPLIIFAALVCSVPVANAATFEFVALPDTQYYSANSYWWDGSYGYHFASGLIANFNAQTQWIIDNRTSKNIVFVSHMGDVIDGAWPPIIVPQATQWANAQNAMSTIANAVPSMPYSVCKGNHDSGFETYFGASRYAGASWYPSGANNGYKNVDHFQVFSAPEYGQILHINLTDVPGTDDLSWAQNVINNFPHIPTVISTHDYLTHDGVRSTVGNTLWNNLIKSNPQVFLVLCGHDYGSGTTPGTAHLSSLNNVGEAVMQVISDYQNLNGGDGYLREIVFNTGADGIGSVTFKSYSLTKNSFRDQDGFSYTASFGSLIHNGEPLNKVWKGGNVNQWNLDASNLDWVASAPSPGCYVQDAKAHFDDSAQTRTIYVGAKVTPFEMTIDNSTGNDFTINSSADGLSGTISGRGKITKLGTGKLTMTGVNSFVGDVFINGGIVSVAALADRTVGSALGAGQNFSIDGGALQITGSTPSITNRGVILGTGGGIIELPTSASQVTLSGMVVGNGGLTKIGAGTLILTGEISYTGATAINAGTLAIENGMANTLSAISGACILIVGGTNANTTLKTSSIEIDTLMIGTPPLMTAVPEPGMLTLLALAELALISGYFRCKKRTIKYWCPGPSAP